jgi:hypothetical protein
MHASHRSSMKTLPAAGRGLTAALLLIALSSPAWSQTFQTPVPPRVTKEVDMSGPRFGLTVLSQGNVDRLKELDIDVRPLISQFGWQFERRFYTTPDGLMALSEWIPLISGLEQGVALPSLNWLVGVRSPSGTEFGIGPNITPVGVGLVVAAGVTVRSGALNIPLNFALASSQSGVRVSIMTGFNLRR